MTQLSIEETLQYVHSPVHLAVARRDYAALRRVLSSLPTLANPGEIITEAESLAEEKRADVLSAVIDRRDVPGRITALQLAVSLGDAVAAEILMAAGADWSLQNDQGWNALQEAICAKENTIARAIVRYYQRLAWLKWCRRLPRLIGVMQRMRDFYMELTFHFQSSVIPFIGRIAPSDTYKIWKCGANLRADMTLAGFDGFRILRSDQSVLFLGEGSADGKLPPGYLCILNHKNKEVMNAVEGADSHPSDAEIAQEVVAMSQTNMYRPGIDVTQAELVPQWTWRRQEKTEMVGPWKSKIYEMQHVMLSFKSKRVPGAATAHEFFRSTYIDREDGSSEGHHGELLTEEERHSLETALKMDGMVMDTDGFADGKGQVFNSNYGKGSVNSAPTLDRSSSCTETIHPSMDNKKGWFKWSRPSSKHEDGITGPPRRNSVCVEKKLGDLLEGHPSCAHRTDQTVERTRRSVASRPPVLGHSDGFEDAITVPPRRNSVCIEKKMSDLLEGHPNCGRRTDQTIERTRRSVASRPSAFGESDGFMLRKEHGARMSISKEGIRKRRATLSSGGSAETEYKKGLRPVLWLTESFPLDTEELLPLLDILANKVKAVRRLREVLATKMPHGTFPVKIAIPVVPTIQVVVTFTRFEELGSTDEFTTPLSSPQFMHDAMYIIEDEYHEASNSLPSRVKDLPNRLAEMPADTQDLPEDIADPFVIPNEYVWTSINAKGRHKKDKRSKGKKGK